VYLGPALGVYIQAHIVLLIMIVSLVLHAYTRPFKERIIDNMEFVSIGNTDDIAVCCPRECLKKLTESLSVAVVGCFNLVLHIRGIPLYYLQPVADGVAAWRLT